MRGEDEALDAGAGGEGVDDFGDVGEGHSAVGVVVEFDGDGGAGSAGVEAARVAGARFEVGETALFELALQSGGEWP